MVACSNQVAPHDSSTEPGHKPTACSTEFQLKKQLILLATLVATVTYAAGLNLPGGVWQDTQDGHHHAGDPILPDMHYHRYLAFYYCNSAAFATSLVACLLLLVHDKRKTWATVLRAIMVLDLLGLMGAYAAGSCRDTFTTIYASMLVTSVFAHIMSAFAFRWVRREPRETGITGCGDVEKTSAGGAGDAREHEEKYEVLMLLATFAVTITYVAGLNPPGGLWGSTQDGQRVSDPIMQDRNRYQAFFVCNNTAFVASLLIVVLLVEKKMDGIVSARFVALYGFIVVALFGLVGAYAAGSCREAKHTIYVVSLAGLVLAYMFLHVVLINAIKKYECGRKQLKTIGDFTSTWLKKISDLFTPSSAPPPDGELEKNRSLILLLATLVVSITYQAGLDPPGGLWQNDQDKHKGGDPVLLTTHPTRYKVFFYSNSAAFVACILSRHHNGPQQIPTWAPYIARSHDTGSVRPRKCICRGELQGFKHLHLCCRPGRCCPRLRGDSYRLLHIRRAHWRPDRYR